MQPTSSRRAKGDGREPTIPEDEVLTMENGVRRSFRVMPQPTRDDSAGQRQGGDQDEEVEGERKGCCCVIL